MQLGGFVLTSFFAGRVATPSARFFVISLLVLAASNGLSALVDDFSLLLVSRGTAGLALGGLTWLAWAGVFGDPEGMGDIAVIGPLAGVVASPLIGFLIDAASYRWVFLSLAVVSLLPLLRVPVFPAQTKGRGPRARGGAPAAYAMVAALGVLAMGGSGVFIYSGLIAADGVGMSASTLSLVFAGNAAASIPSARWRGRRPAAGLFFAICGACAVTMTVTSSAPVLSVAIILWGFCFWFGVPGAYRLLSERSRFPAERAGDAQAAMAVGRIVGPLFGGALVSAGSFATLGLVGGGVMISAGLVVLAVEFGVSPSTARS